MKKKILSILLCVMLVLPFAVSAVADSDAPFENIGTISKDDYYSDNAVIIFLAKKLPEIKRYPGRDCFEAYGLLLSAIEVYTDLDAYDTSDDMRASYLIALSKNKGEIFVRAKLAKASDISYALDSLISDPDILAFDEYYLVYNTAFIEGDINGDGSLDAWDYLLLKRACLKTFYLYDREIGRADMNRNGVIDPQDYVIIKRMVLGTYSPESEGVTE